LYYDTALAAPALADKADSALILGMGTGTYARQLRQYYPKMSIQGVEIDQSITNLAGKYFDEPSNIPVSTYDGRAWLEASDEKFDVIMVDAYQDITIPFQMSSQEFFSSVRQHLNPGGVMVVNMNMISDGEGSINQALQATISSVFNAGANSEAVVTADVAGTTNRELFAKAPSKERNATTNTVVSDNTMQESAKASTLQNRTEELTGDTELTSYMGEVASHLVTVDTDNAGDSSQVLTDDKAPVELLGMRAIDELIAQQSGPYKEVLRTKGISGLMQMQ
jgi:spermidine synthase